MAKTFLATSVLLQCSCAAVDTEAAAITAGVALDDVKRHGAVGHVQHVFGPDAAPAGGAGGVAAACEVEGDGAVVQVQRQ